MWPCIGNFLIIPTCIMLLKDNGAEMLVGHFMITWIWPSYNSKRGNEYEECASIDNIARIDIDFHILF